MKNDASKFAPDELRVYIREIRKARGLSVRQVAERAGIDFSGLARIENGRTVHSPRPETLKKLACALDVPVTELLTRVGYDVAPERPDLRTYLCERYGPLPERAIAKICAFVELLVAECRLGGGRADERKGEHDPRRSQH